MKIVPVVRGKKCLRCNNLMIEFEVVEANGERENEIKNLFEAKEAKYDFCVNCIVPQDLKN